MTRLEVLNPIGSLPAASLLAAAPLSDLEGKTLGLVWNRVAGGDAVMDVVREEMATRFPTTRIRFFLGGTPLDRALIEQVCAECDAVVAAIGDVGVSSQLLVEDCLKIELAGTPAVAVLTDQHQHFAHGAARSLGMHAYRYILVPTGLGEAKKTQLGNAARELLSQMIAVLTSLPTRLDRTGDSERETLAFTGDDQFVTWEEFNRQFLDEGWGDGYPLYPPTVERVKAVLAGASGNPEAPLFRLPPAGLIATLRNLAVNAAMAGCHAAELPIIVAALQAIATSVSPYVRIALSSTSAHAPLTLISGPIAAKLGINYGQGCIGPGSQNLINLRIGRAIYLALRNVGGWAPPLLDPDTLGTTRKLSLCLAENGAESPWGPYHVSVGWRPGDDTVSVFFTSGEWDVLLATQEGLSADQIAAALAAQVPTATGLPHFATLVGNEATAEGRLMFIPPEHARLLTQGGFSRARLQEFLFQHVTERVARLAKAVPTEITKGQVLADWAWLRDASEAQLESTVTPLLRSPADYHVVVAGSAVANSSRGKEMIFPFLGEPLVAPIQQPH